MKGGQTMVLGTRELIVGRVSDDGGPLYEEDVVVVQELFVM